MSALTHQQLQHAASNPAPPFLTDAEVANICDPLVMPAAQLRYLKRLGLIVNRKPNGRPLVARGEFERVLVGRGPDTAQNDRPSEPNRTGLIQLFESKRGKKA